MNTVNSRVNRVDTIPKRKGTRPTMICGPLHIQCGGSGDAKCLRKLITEALSRPFSVSTDPSILEFQGSGGRTRGITSPGSVPRNLAGRRSCVSNDGLAADFSTARTSDEARDVRLAMSLRPL